MTATCLPMRAHWRHLANSIEAVHPSAHSSPQFKRQIDRLSRFAQLTAESAYNSQWAPRSIRIVPTLLYCPYYQSTVRNVNRAIWIANAVITGIESTQPQMTLSVIEGVECDSIYNQLYSP